METVKLDNPTISVEHPNGQTYILADPIEFVLNLMSAGLIDQEGEATGPLASIKALRDKVCEAFGFPSLTYAQMKQVMEAVKAFIESLQKKTPSLPTSPSATASSPKRMPVG